MSRPELEDVAWLWSELSFDVSLQLCLLAALGAVLCVFLRKSDPRLRHLVWLLVLARLAIPFDLHSPVGLSPSLSSSLSGLALPSLDRFLDSENTAEPSGSAIAAVSASATGSDSSAANEQRVGQSEPATSPSSVSRRADPTGLHRVAFPSLARRCRHSFAPSWDAPESHSVSPPPGPFARSPVLPGAIAGSEPRPEETDPDPGSRSDDPPRPGSRWGVATQDPHAGPHREVVVRR